MPELIQFTRGNWIGQVEIGGTYYAAYAYVRIPLTDRSRIDWTDDALPPKLGQIMGRMHRLSGLYQPEPGRPRMRQWDEVDWLDAPGSVLHSPPRPPLPIPSCACETRSRGSPGMQATMA